jgi:alkylation response protein AidB-like acyl-CoA dehydrogenase
MPMSSAPEPTSTSAHEQREFRDYARRWLRENAPPPAPVRLPLSAIEVMTEPQRDYLQSWQRKCYEAGLVGCDYPKAYGGGGHTGFQRIANQELGRAAVPFLINLVGLNMAAPTILVHGTDEQKKRFIPGALSGEEIWCQGFSEPGAGSDLAAVRTRARQVEGDEWVIDGQKVWTSGAQFADYGLLLARTDPDVVKQAGITAFLVPMDAPGVEVRPIRQMSGGASFNEVFLSGVRVPDRLRIGRPGQGWEVAATTLAFERTASGSGNRRKGGTFSDVLALARSLDRTSDPLVRQRLADLYVRAALRAATVDRVARTSAAGGRPGPEASLTKLMASDLLTRTGQVAAELMGARISADTGEPGTFAWTQHLLGAPGYRLAGGTDQIQRNLIGERVLKLPPEPRADRAPFSQLSGN